MVSGITGRAFHAAESVSEVSGTRVGVRVRVAAGVMGENCFGFCVAVGCEAGATASAGTVCVGRLTDRLVGICVVAVVQEGIRIAATRRGIKTRFIRAKYSGEKLSNNEFLCYTHPYDIPGTPPKIRAAAKPPALHADREPARGQHAFDQS